MSFNVYDPNTVRKPKKEEEQSSSAPTSSSSSSVKSPFDSLWDNISKQKQNFVNTAQQNYNNATAWLEKYKTQDTGDNGGDRSNTPKLPDMIEEPREEKPKGSVTGTNVVDDKKEDIGLTEVIQPEDTGKQDTVETAVPVMSNQPTPEDKFAGVPKAESGKEDEDGKIGFGSYLDQPADYYEGFTSANTKTPTVQSTYEPTGTPVTQNPITAFVENQAATGEAPKGINLRDYSPYIGAQEAKLGATVSPENAQLAADRAAETARTKFPSAGMPNPAEYEKAYQQELEKEMAAEQGKAEQESLANYLTETQPAGSGFRVDYQDAPGYFKDAEGNYQTYDTNNSVGGDRDTWLEGEGYASRVQAEDDKGNPLFEDENGKPTTRNTGKPYYEKDASGRFVYDLSPELVNGDVAPDQWRDIFETPGLLNNTEDFTDLLAYTSRTGWGFEGDDQGDFMYGRGEHDYSSKTDMTEYEYTSAIEKFYDANPQIRQMLNTMEQRMENDPAYAAQMKKFFPEGVNDPFELFALTFFKKPTFADNTYNGKGYYSPYRYGFGGGGGGGGGGSSYRPNAQSKGQRATAMYNILKNWSF